jgi:hypothetical protein
MAFCNGLSLARRGHSYFDDGSWQHVFCIAEKADVEKFKARFGGPWFKPEGRGRGLHGRG